MDTSLFLLVLAHSRQVQEYPILDWSVIFSQQPNASYTFPRKQSQLAKSTKLSRFFILRKAQKTVQREMKKATAIASILLLVSLSLQEIAYAVSLSERNQVPILCKKLQTTLVVKKQNKIGFLFIGQLQFHILNSGFSLLYWQ